MNCGLGLWFQNYNAIFYIYFKQVKANGTDLGQIVFLTLGLLGNFFMLSVIQNQLLKIISGIPSECQTVWIQIRPGVLSGLIWV